MAYQYNPAPGPQQPQRYPTRPGPNYQQFGEQQGYLYDSYTDQYYRDPRAVKEHYQNQGLIPPDPKQPGLAEQLLPIVGVGGALVAGQQLGKEIPGLLGDIGGGIGDSIGSIGNLGSAPTSGLEATAGNFSFTDPTGAADSYLGSAFGGGGEQAAGMFDLGGIGSAGNIIAPAAGAYGAYDLLTNEYGAGRGALQGAASGAAIGSYFGPPGMLVGGAIGGAIGLGKSFLDKPSMKEQIKERWGDLAGSSDPTLQSYAQQYLSYLDSPQAEADAQIPFEELKKQGLKPEQVWGAYGLFDLFGSDWLNKYNEDQRRQISQALIDADMFTSEKGDLRLKDKAEAKKIAEQTLNPQPVQSVQSQTPVGTTTVIPGMFADPLANPKPIPRPILNRGG